MSRPELEFDYLLREIPLDDEQAAESCAEHERVVAALKVHLNALAEPDIIDVTNLGRAMQRLSEAQRFCHLWTQSIATKDEVIALWDDLGRTKAAFLVRMQRAVARSGLGEGERALAELEELQTALENDRSLDCYEDFYFEYRGRVNFEVGRLEASLADLERAAQLRRARGVERIVRWTDRLIAAVREAAQG